MVAADAVSPTAENDAALELLPLPAHAEITRAIAASHVSPARCDRAREEFLDAMMVSQCRLSTLGRGVIESGSRLRRFVADS